MRPRQPAHSRHRGLSTAHLTSRPAGFRARRVERETLHVVGEGEVLPILSLESHHLVVPLVELVKLYQIRQAFTNPTQSPFQICN